MVGDLMSVERREEAIRKEVGGGGGGVRGSGMQSRAGELDPAVQMGLSKPLHGIGGD